MLSCATGYAAIHRSMLSTSGDASIQRESHETSQNPRRHGSGWRLTVFYYKNQRTLKRMWYVPTQTVVTVLQGSILFLFLALPFTDIVESASTATANCDANIQPEPHWACQNPSRHNS